MVLSRDGTGAPSIRQSKAKKARQKFDDRLCFARYNLPSAGSDDCPYGMRVLYIKEHLAPAPDSELPDGNMEPDDPAPPFQWKKLSERNKFKAARGVSKA